MPNGPVPVDQQVDRSEIEAKNVTKKTWVCQKYLENPLLIFNRKFDIRVWLVVASWNPLRVYWYKNCYVRFSGQDYDHRKIKNLFSHLTNHAITSK
jgi:tubulin monoglycylase TTLL3/8